jgi:hypothetical protein
MRSPDHISHGGNALSFDFAKLLQARRHVILCCDCEGSRDELSRLYEAIENAGIGANFFFVGDTAEAHSDLVQEIAGKHQSESHTMTHRNLRQLSYDEQRHEITRGRQCVETVIGRKTHGFRAPYHALNRDTVRILNEEGFLFDASMLYYHYSPGPLFELKPTWFREWMPLYGSLGLSAETTFGIFRGLVKMKRVSVLPAHPQYSGKDSTMAAAFQHFLEWCVREDAFFWPIDLWLQAHSRATAPAWSHQYVLQNL